MGTDPGLAPAAQAKDGKRQQKLLLKETIKAQRAKPKAKGKAKATVRLLSPERAVTRANNQDLLFGTSSQLAREESPTLIRDLQRAVKDSETIDGTQLLSQGNESQLSIQSVASNTSSIRRSAGSRNLWSVAARDNAGSLHHVDVVNLVDTPQASRSYSTNVCSTHVAGAQEVLSDLAPNTLNQSWREIKHLIVPEDAQAPVTEQHEARSPLPRSVAEASLRERPRSKSPARKHKIQDSVKISATEPLLSKMPDYSAYTDMQLTKAVVAFGFRSKQSRKNMITLLQECWHSKHQRALQSLPPTLSMPSAPAEVSPEELPQSRGPEKKRGRPPKSAAVASTKDTRAASDAPTKKSRGRPRKTAVAEILEPEAFAKLPNTLDPRRQGSEAPVEQVSDFDDTRPTSPPRRRRASSRLPDACERSTSRVAKLTAEETDALFATITKAIKSHPPTHDAKNLTWYEKFLLYDPIILEDLADWLNNEGLRRVECVTIVNPLIVKQWCESKSICCLWRENLRGGTRARY